MYSICESLLTLEEPGKAKPGNPISVFDCVVEGGLKEVILNETRVDGFIQAYKVSTKLGIKLCYGVKLVVCADHKDKSVESRRTESKVVVMMRDTTGYSQLLKLWSRAWTDGHVRMRLGGDDYAYGRLDWDLLNTFWTPNLLLALPYTSSFLARNTLTMNQITPRLPAAPWIYREVDSFLPFAPLIDAAIARYVAQEPAAQVLPTKHVYYRTRADMKAYTVLRAIDSGGTWEDPKTRHLCSDNWCWEAFRELSAQSSPPATP